MKESKLPLLLAHLLYIHIYYIYVMLLLMMTVAGIVGRVSVIPSASFHIYYVRGCCKGAATGLCECIKYKADPLGDRHAVSLPLCLEVNNEACLDVF